MANQDNLNYTMEPAVTGTIKDGDIGFLICGDVENGSLGLCIFRVKVHYRMLSSGEFITWYESAPNDQFPEEYVDGEEQNFECYHLYAGSPW